MQTINIAVAQNLAAQLKEKYKTDTDGIEDLITAFNSLDTITGRTDELAATFSLCRDLLQAIACLLGDPEISNRLPKWLQKRGDHLFGMINLFNDLKENNLIHMLFIANDLENYPSKYETSNLEYLQEFYIN